MRLFTRYLTGICLLLLPYHWAQAAATSNASLMQIAEPSLSASPLHKHEIKDILAIDETLLNALKVGDSLTLPLPTGRSITAVLWRKAKPISHKSTAGYDARSVFSIEGENGSVELLLQNGKLREYLYYDLSGNTPRVFRSLIGVATAAPASSSGAAGAATMATGSITEVDAHDYFCIDMPNAPTAGPANASPAHANSAQANPAHASPAHANSAQARLLNPELAGAKLSNNDGVYAPPLEALKALQSKQQATNVLYIDYWGGTVAGTSWNIDYSENSPIDYKPFNAEGSSTTFSQTERALMWLGWLEAVEDYAQFDINVTTDQAVYNAAPASNRSRVIVTSTKWYRNIGGVAYIDSFGNSDRDVGWVWNATPGSLGNSISHEAGHQLNLRHHGNDKTATQAESTYYKGHGSWGPIMGAPFGKSYIQWSKGEYLGANNTAGANNASQDDIATIIRKIGSFQDIVSGDKNSITHPPYTLLLNKPKTFNISARGNGAEDIDVFMFEVTTPKTLSVDVAPVLPINMDRLYEEFGTNLSLNVKLTKNGITIKSLLPSLPLKPQTNVFSYTADFSAGKYILTVRASSPNIDWTTGFGEYGNGGLYNVAVSHREVDLSALSLTTKSNKVYGGQTIVLDAQIQNFGDIISKAVTIEIFQSLSDSAADLANKLSVDTQKLAPLSISTAYQFEILLPAPNVTGARWYTFCAQADINERNTDNNCSEAVKIDFEQSDASLNIADATDTNTQSLKLNWWITGSGLFHQQAEFTYDGEDAARVSDVGNNQSASIELEISDIEKIAFHWKVSSETSDIFRFYIDGMEKNRISGEVDWTRVEHALSAGRHRLKWTYAKGIRGSRGLDSGFLDQIELTLENDVDKDGVSGRTDNCIAIPNPKQLDTDKDKLGNVCDDDDDGDEVLDKDDNCPLKFNPEQENRDENKAGDACDASDFCFPVIGGSGTAVICL